MSVHCINLQGDRSLGKLWEQNFCAIAEDFGYCYTPLQIGKNDSSAVAMMRRDDSQKTIILPDVVLWSHPTTFHEIKHKKPRKDDRIGLELYRFESLKELQSVTKQTVFYTIHNHALSGGRDGPENNIDHWFSCPLCDLDWTWSDVDPWGITYRSGRATESIILYWDMSLFLPLSNVLSMRVDQKTIDDRAAFIARRRGYNIPNAELWFPYCEKLSMRVLPSPLAAAA